MLIVYIEIEILWRKKFGYNKFFYDYSREIIKSSQVGIIGLFLENNKIRICIFKYCKK